MVQIWVLFLFRLVEFVFVDVVRVFLILYQGLV